MIRTRNPVLDPLRALRTRYRVARAWARAWLALEPLTAFRVVCDGAERFGCADGPEAASAETALAAAKRAGWRVRRSHSPEEWCPACVARHVVELAERQRAHAAWLAEKAAAEDAERRAYAEGHAARRAAYEAAQKDPTVPR